MLAYVFWHWPVVDAGYASALAQFHRALRADRPAGFVGSRVFRVGRRPWLPVEDAYEDWYFVDDFAALGSLNAGAVSGTRRAVHDAVAALPAGGVGALYAHVRGEVTRPVYAAFRAKTRGATYPAYLGSLPAEAEIWQRQMVLGPSPEYCLLTDRRLDDSLSLEPVPLT